MMRHHERALAGCSPLPGEVCRRNHTVKLCERSRANYRSFSGFSGEYRCGTALPAAESREHANSGSADEREAIGAKRRRRDFPEDHDMMRA
jgi:hypothetical protein